MRMFTNGMAMSSCSNLTTNTAEAPLSFFFLLVKVFARQTSKPNVSNWSSDKKRKQWQSSVHWVEEYICYV